MLATSFKTAAVAATAVLTISGAAAASSPKTWPVHSYKSSTAAPPVLKVSKTGPTVPGYLFFAPTGATGTNAPFIMDESGDLIWQGPEGGMFNFGPQHLDNEPVLTWWNGTFEFEFGVGYGEVSILDNQYRVKRKLTSDAVGVKDIRAPDLPDAGPITSDLDIHESTITKDGTLLATSQNVTQLDLSSVGGPKDGWVINSQFYEIDLVKNQVLFHWRATDHLEDYPLKNVIDWVPLDGAGQNSSNPWDFFHMNSIDKLQDGTYIMNARHYSTFAHILKNGTVAWKCQGITGDDFSLGPGVSYRYEHDVRVIREYADGRLDISMFDNNFNGLAQHPNASRGLILSVDTVNKTVDLKTELIDPELPLYASSQGSVRNLNQFPGDIDGHYLIEYGIRAYIQEYTAWGEPVLTVQYGGLDEEGDFSMSYRAFKSPWVGYPAEDPAIHAERNGKQTDVYGSWNGATEHKTWTVYAGEEKDALYQVGRAARTGFETKITVPGHPKYVRLEATGNNVYGRSKIATVSTK
ncbi:hypothetical protein KEM52_005137 [Ascosphaera acerosa]|nr:hypothetical protein KEM52_005137 [Ascosphaera acerosa]